MAGQIDHALYVVVKCTTGAFVPPAYHAAGTVVWYDGKPVFDLASGIDWAGRLRVMDPQDPANR